MNLQERAVVATIGSLLLCIFDVLATMAGVFEPRLGLAFAIAATCPAIVAMVVLWAEKPRGQLQWYS